MGSKTQASQTCKMVEPFISNYYFFCIQVRNQQPRHVDQLQAVNTKNGEDVVENSDSESDDSEHEALKGLITNMQMQTNITKHTLLNDFKSMSVNSEDEEEVQAPVTKKAKKMRLDSDSDSDCESLTDEVDARAQHARKNALQSVTEISPRSGYQNGTLRTKGSKRKRVDVEQISGDELSVESKIPDIESLDYQNRGDKINENVQVPIAKKSDVGGRIYNKVQCCFYCGKLLKMKISRHLKFVHRKKFEEYTSQQNSDAKISLQLLKNKGTFFVFASCAG